MNKLLTVTIPAYNAEKYLPTCLDSLCIPEIIDYLDIIVINDGSKDASAETAERYVSKYPESVRLINKENGGHGSGINRGIEEARGLFFKVCDADDWYDYEGLKELIGFIRNDSKGTDLIFTNFLWAIDNGSGDPASFQKKAQFEKPFDNVQYNRNYVLDNIAEKLYIKFHNLAVRTSLLKENHIRVDEHCYYEDTEYALYPLAYAETIAFIENPVYMYRIGTPGQSMSMDKLQRNIKNYDLVFGSLLNFYNTASLSEPLKKYTENFIARFHAGRIKIGLSLPVGKESRKKITELEKRLCEEYPEIYAANVNKAVSLLRKSRYLLYYPAALLIRFRGTI